MAAPAVLYLAIFCAVPLALLLGRSVLGPEGLTLANHIAFLSDPFAWTVIGNTLSIAGQVTVIALVIGYPMAFALARARGALQIILLVAIILPLSVGVVVKAFAWAVILRRNGALNQLLLSLGVTDEPLRLLFTETGLVLGAVNVFLPFMVLPIYSVVRMVDPRLPDAAATLGASPLRRFLRVTLPLTLPGVVTGVAFVFSLAISMYVIPSLLIGDRFQTLATLTARSFLFLRNEALGGTAASILLVIALLVVTLSGWLARRLGAAR
ncbi:MAG: ABC transporter permease [Acetobacteraceae bacterium]|nr:ABC transporter permease [Acetobacteraceae bacterium]